MPVLTLTWNPVPMYVAETLIQGCIKKNYPLAADARIKTQTLKTGVGPLCHIGKASEGTSVGENKMPDDGLFFFLDEDGNAAKYAVLENVDPTDLEDTVNDFLTNMGGNIATMKARMPA